MNVKAFLKFVEIQTKVASMIPFLLGTLFVLYIYEDINMINLLLMFVSLISVDMATTALNNYFDHKKAIKKEGFGYEHHNAMKAYELDPSLAKNTVIALVVIAASAGLVLYMRTNIIVLLLGMVSFSIGVIYSYGPVPISRTPFGEFFSGFFMGVIIVFISIYIHIYDKGIFYLLYSDGMITVNADIRQLLYIFLFCIPTFMGIANIMLANNICDMEDDIVNKRYTLPIFIGEEKALKLFNAIYMIAYAAIAVLMVLGIEPYLSVVALLTAIPVKKNIEEFKKLHTKKDTFVLAVKNFLLINGARVAALTMGILLERL